MPRVEQFGQSKVATQVVRGARAQAAPAGAFGGDVTRGLADFAGGAFKLKERLDTTAAEESLVNFERDKNALLFNPESGYFNTQGRNAYDSAEGTNKALTDLKRSYSDGLDSATSKQLFGKSADAHIARSNVDIMRHSAKGLQAWEVATINSQVENTVENAAIKWTDPKGLGVQNALGRAAIIDAGNLQGLSSETINENLQTYNSSFYSTAISAATSSSSIDGQDAMDKYGNRLEGPDKIKLDKAIGAKQKVEKTQSDALAATTTAVNLVDTYDTRAEINSEVDKIEDPELQKRTRSEAMSQFNLKRREENEDKDAAYNVAIDHVNSGGTPSEFMASSPEEWEAMDSKQRNNILSGKHMITDEILFNELLGLPKNELAKVDAAKYSARLKPTAVQKVRTAVNNAKKGHSNSAVQELSTKVNAIAVQVFGKKSTWSKRGGGLKPKGERANAFMTEVQEVVTDAEDIKGGKLSPKEVDDVLADFTRKVTLERSIFGIDLLAPDLDLDLSTLPANEIKAFNQALDALGDDGDKFGLNEAREFLLDNEIEVTKNILINAYRQGTRGAEDGI